MSEILSQEEIDALLKGVVGEKDEDGAEDNSQAGIQAYNFAKQERIVRGRMPTLEIINERFARLFRIGLFTLLRRNAGISVEPVKVLKYSEFIKHLIVPSSLNIVHVKPLRGTALFIYDPNFVFHVVDSLFGGAGQFHMRVEGRDFSPTEQRIIQNILNISFEEMQKAWKSVFEVEFEYIRSEMNTQFANIASPSEVVVVSTFSIEIGSRAGEFHVCMPYSMIEPIRDKLTSTIQGDRMEIDDRWLTLLRKQMHDTEVELVAEIGSIEMTVEQLLNIQPGDVLPINVPNTLSVNVEKVPVLECRYGTRNGKYALQVESVAKNIVQLLSGGDRG